MLAGFALNAAATWESTVWDKFSPLVITDGVVLTENDEEHSYKLEGKPIPGCSHILERAGLVNYDQVPDDGRLGAKGMYGSAVHEYCHWWDEDDLDIEDLKHTPRYYNPVVGWTQFRELFQFTPAVIEQPIAIRVNGMVFGVKPDRFGMGACGPDGEPVICTVEIKTTADVEYAAKIQTAAQGLAVKTPENPIPVRLIVQLRDTADSAGNFFKVTQPKDPLDEKVWLAALLLEYAKINNKIK